jgi:ferrochelatase
LENIEQAQREVGAKAPRVDKLRAYFNHPGFIEAWIDRARSAFAMLPPDEQQTVQVVFTAHSIPLSMAVLAYQSRSGPPSQPWLEPDIVDCLRSLKADGASSVVVAPIGFISDHIEVLYDLDTEARQAAEQLGMRMIRVPTPGTHPRFVRMIRELVVERLTGADERPAFGSCGPSHDVCPVGCCL